MRFLLPLCFAGIVAAQSITIPENSTIDVVMENPIDTRDTHPGQLYHASVVYPVMAGDTAAIPEGSDVQIAVVESRNHKGKPNYALTLVHITVKGQARGYDCETYELAGHGMSAGVIFGAMAAGATEQLQPGERLVMTPSHIRVPSQKQLHFTLKAPLVLHWISLGSYLP